MVNGVGRGGGLAQEAILAALRNQAGASARIERAAQDIAAAAESIGSGGAADPRANAGAPAEGGSFAEALREGAREVVETVARAEDLPEDMLRGEVTDFHEIAARLKQADLSFKFSLEVRNKLIDAYREVMRMTV